MPWKGPICQSMLGQLFDGLFAAVVDFQFDYQRLQLGQIAYMVTPCFLMMRCMYTTSIGIPCT